MKIISQIWHGEYVREYRSGGVLWHTCFEGMEPGLRESGGRIVRLAAMSAAVTGGSFRVVAPTSSARRELRRLRNDPERALRAVRGR